MKVLRAVLLCGLFIIGVFVCSANVHLVDLVVWPSFGLSAAPPPQSVAVPLFVLVLGSVLSGVLLGGAAALFEQGRLRWGLRRAEKTSKRLKAEASAAEANMTTQREEVERLSRELEGLRRELAQLEAGSPAVDDVPGTADADTASEKDDDVDAAAEADGVAEKKTQQSPVEAASD